MATVETHDVKKLFGRILAVDSVSLATKEGEFLVLPGPSGCGKTTPLRMVAGLERPTEGEILIGGQVVNDLPPRARKIAMVFQSYALYPHMSVSKNIAFPLKAQAWTRRRSPRRWSGPLPSPGSGTPWSESPGNSPRASASGWRWLGHAHHGVQADPRPPGPGK
jgi:ABC-type sugar transport system ATPase subunit